MENLFATNFISSKDNEEERVMHSSNDNIKLQVTVMRMMLSKISLIHFVQNIWMVQKHQWKEVILLLIQFN